MCAQLKNIDLSKGVEIIDNYAFYSSGIKKLVLPIDLYEIGGHVVYGDECKVIYPGTEEQ